MSPLLLLNISYIYFGGIRILTKNKEHKNNNNNYSIFSMKKLGVCDYFISVLLVSCLSFAYHA